MFAPSNELVLLSWPLYKHVILLWISENYSFVRQENLFSCPNNLSRSFLSPGNRTKVVPLSYNYYMNLCGPLPCPPYVTEMTSFFSVTVSYVVATYNTGHCCLAHGVLFSHQRNLSLRPGLWSVNPSRVQFFNLRTNVADTLEFRC